MDEYGEKKPAGWSFLRMEDEEEGEGEGEEDEESDFEVCCRQSFFCELMVTTDLVLKSVGL